MKLSSSKSTSSALSSSNNALSKLRRLKIEENLLLQSLQKVDTKLYNHGFESLDLESVTVGNSDYKNMLKKLQDTYTNLANLFDDVKTMSSTQDILAELDIEDIKSKVLELEKSLKSSKNYLNTELNSLKIAEKEIMKHIEEINIKETAMGSKKRPKIPSANLNQIVPSPVRLLMTSPLKCSEVQNFQDFMKNSPNRYGGWIEYNHNIFVKYWQKYFGDIIGNIDPIESYVENLSFENFVDEVLLKVQGVDRSIVISHIEWYKKYLFLKDRQQKAIDKWKSKRRSIRKVPETVSKVMNSLSEQNVHRAKSTRKIDEGDIISRLIQPTEQSKSRSCDQNPTEPQINQNIENIKRL